MNAKTGYRIRAMKSRYGPIEPYDEGMLPVSSIHTIYYEQSGNPEGNPVVFLHGGPGGGTVPEYRQFFSPADYRIILFDQRGSGRSTPYACLEENTTWDLVADIERLREHLGVDRWLVFGGSWGSDLALAYSERPPDRVSELVLWGVPTSGRADFDWLFRGGLGRFLPEQWERLLDALPDREADPVDAFHRLLFDHDPE